ncbi:hypothetical protein PR048_004251 [Dryococelus australis]|uniref:DDE Tnp4 domain-containing protein n=1 Tax=Dryococelus australis TaxID=614101 RepID=A0ABQ9I4Z0_9NEOP|nr:hypothetical protein PR048_004251 [Dryococelus australis]
MELNEENWLKVANAGSAYFDYKSSHSIVMLVLCDARHCDGAIFAVSRFGRAFNNRQLHFPPPRTLPNCEKVAPHVIVADAAAFPLKENLMRPYPDRGLSSSEEFTITDTVEQGVCQINIFGILVRRWSVFRFITITASSIKQIDCCYLHQLPWQNKNKLLTLLETFFKINVTNVDKAKQRLNSWKFNGYK